MDRKSLTKKQRFEIFKRDLFTCQYCGRTPPEIVLEIDHIVPVVNGGDNDETNLITACFDCNRGKGKRELGNISPRPDADLKWLEAQQEIVELERYQIAKKHRDQIYYEVALDLCDTWCSAFQTETCPKESILINLMQQIPPEYIEKAIYITALNQKISGTFTTRYKYMCGVAWNLLKQGNM